jgi:hypothetical protein
MALATVAAVLLVLLAFWVLGGVVLRLVGWALVLLAVFGLVLPPSGDAGTAAMLLLVGAVCWLAGHWHFALRHHTYKSPLAQRVFLQLLPRRLDPTRNWGISVIRADRGRARAPRR